MRLCGADIIVRTIIEQGVDVVFGYPGGQIINVYDSLYKYRDELRHVLTAHEQGAAHAADGYARLTHKASVVMCHLGPGLTNVLTGVANASFDSIPMVVIAGDVPSYYFGRHPHQEINMHADGDQYKMLEPVCKRCWRIDDVEALP